MHLECTFASPAPPLRGRPALATTRDGRYTDGVLEDPLAKERTLERREFVGAICTDQRQLWKDLARKLQMRPGKMFCCCGALSIPGGWEAVRAANL